MSGGATGLGGYIYQQDYLAYRVLASVVARSLDGTALPSLQSFKIEGQASASGPSWDLILSSSNGGIELLECKDTEITKEDRAVFYKRVRREIASSVSAERIQVGWVTDRNKQGNILTYIDGMAALVDDLHEVPESAPTSVVSAATALAEAVYFLCHPDPFVGKEKKCAAIPLASAKLILRRIMVASWSGSALGDAVKQLVEKVFQTGTAAALVQYIRGHLTTEIRTNGEATNTLDGFVDEVGTLSVMVAVEGSLKRFLAKYSAAAQHIPPPGTIVWAQLPGSPKKEWPISQRAPQYLTRKSQVVIAPQGIGKTVLSQQAFAQIATEWNKHRVLRVDAALLEEDLTNDLLSICTVLSGLGATWLSVDGLDAIERSRSVIWQTTIDRILANPRIVLLLTAREEVLEAGEWLQRLTTSLPSLLLKPLSVDQVRDAFTEAALNPPRNESLLKVLRIPFLLSLYARIATPSDLPLEDSGEVTAFQVVEKFWSMRVRAPSEGHRLVGESEESSAAKRASAKYLAERTREGSLAIPRPDRDLLVQQGIQMLLHEGVLIAQGTYSVRWFHDWLREYALVDLIISDIESIGPLQLAQRIILLADQEHRPDYVVRAAAVGGAKWIVAKGGEWGPIEDYLGRLHDRFPGIASEAISVLIEGPEGGLRLARLPQQLLLDAIHLAIGLRAPQWTTQILTLPPQAFLGLLGPQLHRVVTDFELEVMPS
jgi:hypothetical protein